MRKVELWCPGGWFFGEVSVPEGVAPKDADAMTMTKRCRNSRCKIERRLTFHTWTLGTGKCSTTDEPYRDPRELREIFAKLNGG